VERVLGLGLRPSTQHEEQQQQQQQQHTTVRTPVAGRGAA
jgi:hypothetical protein